MSFSDMPNLNGYGIGTFASSHASTLRSVGVQSFAFLCGGPKTTQTLMADQYCNALFLVGPLNERWALFGHAASYGD